VSTATAPAVPTFTTEPRRRTIPPMVRFVVRRLLMVIPILFGVAVLVFLIVKLIPGDPVASLLGPT
jgi:hypothetical protein